MAHILDRTFVLVNYYRDGYFLDRIYYQSQRDGIDFNLAAVGPEFEAAHTEDFDPDYMRALFDYGYNWALNGYPWKKSPQGSPANNRE